jgi:hypothetical protein
MRHSHRLSANTIEPDRNETGDSQPLFRSILTYSILLSLAWAKTWQCIRYQNDWRAWIVGSEEGTGQGRLERDVDGGSFSDLGKLKQCRIWVIVYLLDPK